MNAPGADIPKLVILKLQVGLPNLNQELQDCALAMIGHAADCANGIPFYLSPDDLCFLFYA